MPCYVPPTAAYSNRQRPTPTARPGRLLVIVHCHFFFCVSSLASSSKTPPLGGRDTKNRKQWRSFWRLEAAAWVQGEGPERAAVRMFGVRSSYRPSAYSRHLQCGVVQYSTLELLKQQLQRRIGIAPRLPQRPPFKPTPGVHQRCNETSEAPGREQSGKKKSPNTHAEPSSTHCVCSRGRRSSRPILKPHRKRSLPSRPFPVAIRHQY